ncbi:hypothetical protein WICMUC_004095, partial [Wickerhamomyces mucosus]
VAENTLPTLEYETEDTIVLLLPFEDKFSEFVAGVVVTDPDSLVPSPLVFVVVYESESEDSLGLLSPFENRSSDFVAGVDDTNPDSLDVSVEVSLDPVEEKSLEVGRLDDGGIPDDERLGPKPDPVCDGLTVEKSGDETPDSVLDVLTELDLDDEPLSVVDGPPVLEPLGPEPLSVVDEALDEE